MTGPPLTPATPRHVLVTGGAGFIGSHLTDLLLARDDRVTVVDDLSTGRRDNLPPIHPGLSFVRDDLARFLAGPGRDTRFDQIYHLAAAVGVKLVMDQPVRSIEVNVEQTAALLRFACTAGPDGRPAPVLIASSSEVYGKSAHSPFAEDDDVLYGPTTKGRWSYAASKAIDEYLALAHHAQHALPAVIVRFFNTVGPRQVGTYGMVLPTFVAAALRNADIPVHGDGTQSRCFCDVRDAVTALPPLLERPACAGRVFNLGSDRVITILDLAHEVINVLGSSSRVMLVPYDRAYAAGFEDLAQRKPDLTRIRAAIGFQPRRSLRDTILDLAADLRSRPPAPAQTS
ncbi:MAG: GDP-mannose 4,6-dehydratase [Phycisphaerae bacterium]|nr:GDP-mannose 4,6-dehydratase [Phycisphaerae bacterium]